MGDTLAQVELPEGFSWEDSTLDVGPEGIHTFKAIYTPEDTDRYIYIDNIDVPVTVGNPTIVPTESPTPTTEPTETPLPTKTTTPTKTPTPTETTAPTVTPAPTKTPASTETTAPTKTPASTETTIPTKTPAPTETTSPTKTPAPTETITPTKTPAHTETTAPTPVPTETTTPTPAISNIPKPTETAKPAGTLKPTDIPAPAELTPQEKKKQKKRELTLNSLLKVKQKGKKIIISWGKVSGADGYDVYMQYCSKNFTSNPITSVKKGQKTKVNVKKFNGKTLDLKNIYKIYVVAYRQTGDNKATLAKTITAHVVGTRNTQYTNVKGIKVKKASYTLKKGRSATIRANTVLVSKNKKQLGNDHARKFRYATTNKKIATISKKGKIKAVGKGSCIIYVYARNGYAKKIKVNVK